MSETEMIERVAIALWDSKIAEGGGGRTMMPWPHCPEVAHCRHAAREALKAMRVPTDTMLTALPNEIGHSATLGRIVWQTMIDAALAEE